MPHCTGVIAEYNPFHNGHRYQLTEARRLTGCEFIVVVMSGAFVQRGEVAMFDKFSRARWALQNGADMVLLLPAAYSCATAERFAEGAVRILGGTGLVDKLCFGSESGDVSALKRMAAAEETETHRAELKSLLKTGISFPRALAARADAHASHANGRSADMVPLPNDILGVEYIKAIRRFAPHMEPYAVKRTGAAHDADQTAGKFASASALRRALTEVDTDALRACLPESVFSDVCRMSEAGEAPYLQERLSDVILYALRRMPREALENLPDVSEGLENALYRRAREAGDYGELLTNLKTKRYTLARLRRILVYAFLGVEKGLYKNALPYLRVLGVKKSALPLLGALAKNATLPVITKFSDTAALPEAARLLHEIDLRAADIAPLALMRRKSAAFDYAAPLLIV